MPVFQKPVTVKQIATETKIPEPQVREVIQALQRHGIVMREDEGEQITSATQAGMVSTATPHSPYNADAGVDIAPEYTGKEDAADTRG